MTDSEKRNYDIDQFDWLGQEETVTDQNRVDEVERLIRAALAETTPVDRQYLRPSKVDDDIARVRYNVPYSLNNDQKESIKDLVGDTRTLTFNASGYHDHPISHCLTEINEDMVVNKFGNEPFVSVWGNASRHRRMGHVGAKVVSDRHVPHDWFRNRGMEEVTTDIGSFIKGRGHMRYRLFLATHALYYMSLEDVACWLGGNPDGEFHAIIHRHNKSKGHLNRGELKYTVDTNGNVVQVNPLTGFKYTHKSLEPLFQTDSCRLFEGRVGLTWDINLLAGDQYHVKFVLCDPAKCHKLADPWMFIKRDREVYVRGDVTVYRCMKIEWYVYHGANGQVLLEDVELYDRLRRIIAGKERTPRAHSDLMAMCRRLANKNDIIAIHQGFAHDVPPEMMTDYVNAAFYADVNHELEVALKYHRENREAVEALNSFIREGRAPTDMTNVARVGRAVASPFTKLAGLISERSFWSVDKCEDTGPLDTFRHESHIAASLPPDPFGARNQHREEMADMLSKKLKAG